MQQTETGIQYLYQVAGSGECHPVALGELQFGDLKIPVSKFTPEELVNLATGFPVLVVLEQPLNILIDGRNGKAVIVKPD